MRDFEYLEPATVAEAISLLAKYGGKAKVFAGGTDLLVYMKHGVAKPEYLINIKRIPGMNHISYDRAKGLSIGALATLLEVEKSPVVQRQTGVLAQAAHSVAAPRIRSLGTIGGNLCQDVKCLYYPWAHMQRLAPCYHADGDTCYLVKGAKKCQAMATSELAPALIALEARVSALSAQGERTIPIEKLFIEAGANALKQDEILTGIEIPDLPPRTAGVYLKQSMSGAINCALAGAAVMLTLDSHGGFCSDAKIALIGVTRTPLRAKKAEGMLKGEKIQGNLVEQAAQTAMGEAHPLSDIHGSAAYRRAVVRQLVRKAVGQAADRAAKRTSLRGDYA